MINAVILQTNLLFLCLIRFFFTFYFIESQYNTYPHWILQPKSNRCRNDSVLSGERLGNGHDNSDKGRMRSAGEKEAASSRPCLIRNGQAFPVVGYAPVCAHGHLSVSHGLSHTGAYPTTRPGRNRHGLEETTSFSALLLKTESFLIQEHFV